MARAVGRLMAVPRAIIAALILISIGINFANVIGRYLFLSPIIWAEEVMVFILVWCVFLGAVLTSWDNRHLRMDILAVYLPPRWRRVVNGLVAVLSLALFAFVIAQSLDAVSLYARLGQRSTTAGIPTVIPQAAVPVGFILMFLAVLVRFRLIVSGALGSDADRVAAEVGGVPPADGNAPDGDHPAEQR